MYMRFFLEIGLVKVKINFCNGKPKLPDDKSYFLTRNFSFGQKESVTCGTG
jgi:hypothetical protein